MERDSIIPAGDTQQRRADRRLRYRPGDDQRFGRLHEGPNRGATLRAAIVRILGAHGFWQPCAGTVMRRGRGAPENVAAKVTRIGAAQIAQRPSYEPERRACPRKNSKRGAHFWLS